MPTEKSTRYSNRALSRVTERSLPRRAICGASRRCLTLEKSRLTALGPSAKDVHGSKESAARLVNRIEGAIGDIEVLLKREKSKLNEGESQKRCKDGIERTKRNEDRVQSVMRRFLSAWASGHL